MISITPGCIDQTTQGIAGDRAIATESREIDDFTAIRVRGGLTATVEIGPRRSVVVEGDGNLLPRVTTDVRDGRLIVGIEANQAVRPSRPIVLKITTPGWTTLEALGAARVSAQAGEGESLAVKASGASTVRLFGVKAEALSLEGQGAARIVALGRADELMLALTGAAAAELNQLDASDVTVSASGVSSASIQVKNDVEGNVSGASSLKIAGLAYRRALSSSGASRVVFTSAVQQPGSVPP